LQDDRQHHQRGKYGVDPKYLVKTKRLQLYAPLNIFIALVGVVIWTEHDEIILAANGDTTLTNFLHYRREKLVKEHPNDNAQLLT
jgi:hypothetical protein